MGKFNRFRGESRLTVLGMLNNVNTVDYTEDQVITVLNAGNGITRTMRGGINYSDRWENGAELSSGYNYTHPNTFQESLKERTQFIVPDSSSTLQLQIPQLSYRKTANRTITQPPLQTEQKTWSTNSKTPIIPMEKALRFL